jgi:nicotinamide mononucleotide (NMN) deamidase PncC
VQTPPPAARGPAARSTTVSEACATHVCRTAATRACDRSIAPTPNAGQHATPGKRTGLGAGALAFSERGGTVFRQTRAPSLPRCLRRVQPRMQ